MSHPTFPLCSSYYKIDHNPTSSFYFGFLSDTRWLFFGPQLILYRTFIPKLHYKCWLHSQRRKERLWDSRRNCNIAITGLPRHSTKVPRQTHLHNSVHGEKGMKTQRYFGYFITFIKSMRFYINLNILIHSCEATEIHGKIKSYKKRNWYQRNSILERKIT